MVGAEGVDMFLFLAFGWACGNHSDKSPDGDSAGSDTGGDPEEFYFDLGLARGSCEALLDPWSATTAAEVPAAGPIPEPGPLAGTSAIFGRGDDPCPARTAATEGDTTVITATGGCTTADGVSFAGSFRSEHTPVGEGSVITFTLESFRVDVESESNSYHYAGDGTLVVTIGESGDETETWDLTWGYANGTAHSYGTLLGEVIKSDVSIESDLYIRREDETISGDLCFVESRTSVAECTDEWDGSATLKGAVEAVITWNGSTACDGCADVTIDSTAAGQTCY